MSNQHVNPWNINFPRLGCKAKPNKKKRTARMQFIFIEAPWCDKKPLLFFLYNQQQQQQRMNIFQGKSFRTVWCAFNGVVGIFYANRLHRVPPIYWKFIRLFRASSRGGRGVLPPTRIYCGISQKGLRQAQGKLATISLSSPLKRIDIILWTDSLISRPPARGCPCSRR